MNIKTVFFDLDNTLIDHSAAEERALVDTIERFLPDYYQNVDAVLARYQVINEEEWEEYRSGRSTTALVRVRRWHRLLTELDPKRGWTTERSSEVAHFYLDEYDRATHLIDGAEELLELVESRVDYVGLITNSFPDQVRRKLENRQWTKRFDAVLVSEEVNIRKPDARIFRLAEEQAGVGAESCLYVGDNYEVDMVGAKSAGWNTLWYCQAEHDRSQSSDADYEVRSLHAGRELLATMLT